MPIYVESRGVVLNNQSVAEHQYLVYVPLVASALKIPALLLLLFGLVLPTDLSAQERSSDQVQKADHPTCAEILANSPFVGLDGFDVINISPSIGGEVLVGTHCPPDIIVEFFESRGWIHRRTNEKAKPITVGPDQVSTNLSMNFCHPRIIPFRWFTKPCDANALIYWLDDELVRITTGPVAWWK